MVLELPKTLENCGVQTCFLYTLVNIEYIILQISTLRCRKLCVKYTLILARTAPCISHCHIGDGEIISLQGGTSGCGTKEDMTA
jgi:hypothetical protein